MELKRRPRRAELGALLMLFCFAGIAQAQRTLPVLPTIRSVPAPSIESPVGALRKVGSYPAVVAGSTISRLPDGKVLVFGSDPINWALRDAAGKPVVSLHNRWQTPYRNAFTVYGTNDSLWFDPQRQGWVKVIPSPECAGSRYLHSATVLRNAKVLIAGGLCDLPRIEASGGPTPRYTELSLWNSATQLWENAPALNGPRLYHSATLMGDGSVLFVGGESDPAFSPVGEPVLASVERYDGDSVKTLASLHVARARHTATLLNDGGVLVTGGFDHAGKAIDSVELWDPFVHSWREMPPLHTARYAHTATLLDDGRVMIVGGIGPDGLALNSVELWDPITSRWSMGEPLPRAVRNHPAVKLANGNVLLVGGESQMASEAIDWALLWDKASGEWHAAGSAQRNMQDDVIYSPTLAPLHDGSVLIFGYRGIVQWRPGASSSAAGQPRWRSATSMVALADGRLMVIGETEPNKSTATIWNSRDDSWSSAGVLTHHTRLYARVMALPDGRLMHVGVGDNNDVFCDISDLDDWHWSDCGHLVLEHRSDSPVGLGLMADGRMVLVANSNDAFVYDPVKNLWNAVTLEWNSKDLAYGAPIRAAHPLARIWDGGHDAWFDVSNVASQYWESASAHGAYDVVVNGRASQPVSLRTAPPSLLWDAKLQRWAYVFPSGEMGRDAQFLPDGCALSWPPLRLFNPDTGKASALRDPGIGVDTWLASMTVLADGTAVFAGTPEGGVGSGFFHRKVSCAGFAPAPEDLTLMPGVFSAGASELVQPAPATPVQAPAKRLPEPSAVSDLRNYLHDNPWPLLAVLGTLLLYLLLRYALLPLVRTRARRSISRQHMATLTRELPSSFAWVTRLVIYGLVALVCVPTVMRFVHFQQAQTALACLEKASECLDSRNRVLESIPALESASPDHPRPTIPCRFVGLWSSRQDNTMYRITLSDDGSYSEQANAAGMGNPAGYSGYWMVQGRNMVWRDSARPGMGPDINPILSESDGHFVLVEQSGRHTHFDLLKATPHDRCTQEAGQLQ